MINSALQIFKLQVNTVIEIKNEEFNFMANGVFSPGTGDLKSTNLISAFLELSMIVQTAERIAGTKTAILTENSLTVPDFVQISANFNNDTMTVSIANLPISIAYNAGKIEITAVDYLAPLNAVEPTIINSIDTTGSDLTSANRIGALLELVQLIQEDEAVAGVNNLSFAINADASTASINATFAGVPQINATGLIEFSPINYLA